MADNINGMSLNRMNAVKIMELLLIQASEENWYEIEDKLTEFLDEQYPTK